MANSISFSKCPECEGTIGTRGLARHREQMHGVAPAVTRASKVKLDGNMKLIVRELSEHPGSLSDFAAIYKSSLAKLVKKGLVHEDKLELTEAGLALV